MSSSRVTGVVDKLKEDAMMSKRFDDFRRDSSKFLTQRQSQKSLKM